MSSGTEVSLAPEEASCEEEEYLASKEASMDAEEGS